MKIAMMTNNYKPFTGGIQISVERQARELMRLVHEVTVFAPRYGGTEQLDEEATERIIRYPTGKHKIENGMPYPTIFMGEIHEVFENEQFDCIHVHHPMFIGNCAVNLGKKYGIPVIFTYHTRYGDYLHYLKIFRREEEECFWKRNLFRLTKKVLIPAYMKWYTNQCDLVLAPSEGMKQLVKEQGTNTPIQVFPTGLEEEFFVQNKKESRKIRETYGGDRKYLLCTVSRLEKEKNPYFLLEGIAEMKKILRDNFRLLYIGEGGEKENLCRYAKKLGIEEEVCFLGNIENRQVKNYLNAADLFLYASKSETQGIVLAEAMAAGNPVVAVKAVGVDDIVKDGFNGYRTNEDAEEWAAKAVRSLNPKFHERLKEQALLTAERYRSLSLAMYEESIYAQCIHEKQKKMWNSHGKEELLVNE